MVNCCHICAVATQSSLSSIDIVQKVLHVLTGGELFSILQSFINEFLIDEILEASHRLIVISMEKVQMNYIP